MIEKVVIISLFCVGINKAQGDGMILNWFRRLMNKYFISDIILMPTVGCVYCFASFWGIICYSLLSLAMHYQFNAIEALICCICAIPLNGFIWNYLVKSED